MATGGEDYSNMAAGGQVWVTVLIHSPQHEDGGFDEINVEGLSGVLADAQNTGKLQGVDVSATAPTDSQHLGYDAADEQWEPTDQLTPLAHKTSHQNGGGDEISVAGLSGALADKQDADHLQGRDIATTAPTTAQVLAWNAAETRWQPTAAGAAAAHADQHEDGGVDEISIEGLAGAPAQKAAASGLASLDASSKVVQQPASITDHLEAAPTNGETAKAPNSDWAHDHAASATVHHTKTIDASELTTGELPTARLSTAIKTLTITFIIDGGGSAISAGEKGHLEIPFACTITQVTMLADQSGSIVVDIWKDTYAEFPPIDGDSITASAPPTITTAQKSQDSTLTGWTTSISVGDILAFNVDSCTTITRVTISLKVTKA